MKIASRERRTRPMRRLLARHIGPVWRCWAWFQKSDARSGAAALITSLLGFSLIVFTSKHQGVGSLLFAAGMGQALFHTVATMHWPRHVAYRGSSPPHPTFSLSLITVALGVAWLPRDELTGLWVAFGVVTALVFQRVYRCSRINSARGHQQAERHFRYRMRLALPEDDDADFGSEAREEHACSVAARLARLHGLEFETELPAEIRALITEAAGVYPEMVRIQQPA